MKTLRALPWLRRVMLAGLICAIGAATASPVFRPTQPQWVGASAGGTALAAIGGGGLHLVTATINCPLGLPTAGQASASVTAFPALRPASALPPAPAHSDATTLFSAPISGCGSPVFY